MATRRLELVLDLDTGGYTGRLKRAGGDMQRFSGQVDASNRHLRRMSGEFDALSRNMHRPLDKLRQYVLVFGDLRFAILSITTVGGFLLSNLVKQSAEVERMMILMKGLSSELTAFGKNTDAQTNLRYLFNEARNTGFAVRDLTDAFVKMKSGSVDPMTGSLDDLANAVAFFGGSSDTMHRASIAIQQMGGKGVVSMEELRQQLGEAVPTAMRDMAAAAGMSLKEFTKQVSKGAVQAQPALELMFREFNLLYSGAGKRMAETLSGQFNAFQTNITELATYFTGLAEQNTGKMRVYQMEQKELLDKGVISLDEYNSRLDEMMSKQPIGGLHSFLKDALKDINTALSSDAGRRFFSDLGIMMRDFLATAMQVARFIVKWREEIGSALKFIVVTFGAIKAVQIGRWFAELGISGFNALRGITGELGPMMQRLNNVGTAVEKFGRDMQGFHAIQGRVKQRMLEQAQVYGQNAVQLQQQAQHLRALTVEYTGNLQSINSHVVASQRALDVGRETGRFKNYLTGQWISEARAIELNERALNAQTRARRILGITTRNLTVVERQATAAVNAEAAATARATAMTTRATIAQRAYAAASVAAGVAVRGLSIAVNTLLGPLGIVALLLYEAGQRAGWFANQARDAAEAAVAMAQGIASLDQVKRAAERATSLRADVEERQKLLDGKRGSLSPRLRKKYQQIQNEQKTELQKLESGLQNQTIINNQSTGRSYAQNMLNRREVALAPSRERFARVSSAYREGKASQKELDAARTEAENAQRALDKKNLDYLERQRQLQKAAGKTTVAITAQIAAYREGSMSSGRLEQSTEDVRDKLFGVAKGSDAAAEATKKLSKEQREAQAAQEKYSNMIADAKGRLAELQDELAGGNGELAKFEARLENGRFDGITAEQIAELKKTFGEIDAAQDDLDFKQTFDDLSKDLSRATGEANRLWAALANDEWDSSQRDAQIRSRFDSILESETDPEKLKELKHAVDEIVEKVKSADLAEISRGWKEQTQDILISLMDEDEAREANFQREVARQRQLLNLAQRGTEERRMAEQRFQAWLAAREQQRQRESENQVVRMARDWANLGAGINEAMSGALDGFINSLEGGKFAFGDFAKSLMKDLVKVILKAVIAYAILSAIGATNGQSLGSFMRGGLQQWAGGFTPSTSSPGVAPGSTPTLPVPPGFPTQATGGWMGQPLKPGEIPVIGHEGEVILNRSQQDFYADRLASNAPPEVEINFINNSGVPLTAENSEPRFDGKRMIVDTVVEALGKQGPLRAGIEQITSKK